MRRSVKKIWKLIKGHRNDRNETRGDIKGFRYPSRVGVTLYEKSLGSSNKNRISHKPGRGHSDRGMKKKEYGFIAVYKMVGYPVNKENGEPIRSSVPKESRINKEAWYQGNSGHRIESDTTGKIKLRGNSEIIAARVDRAKVAYRPVNKMSKVTAAELEKSVAVEMGGTVCEWNVPFDICDGNTFIDIKVMSWKKCKG